MKKDTSQEITLDYLIERLCRDFSLKKTTDLGPVFGTYKNLQRIRDPHSKKQLSDTDCRMLLDKVRSVSGDLRGTLVRWFPSLRGYPTEDVVVQAVMDSLLGKPLPQADPSSLDQMDFLRSCMHYASPIRSIRLLTQTGWTWFDQPEKCDLLVLLATEGVSIRVIANPNSKIMQGITATMRDPSKELRYLGLAQTLGKWNAYEQKYPAIQLRISEYPILHQILLVEFTDGTHRVMLRNYVYGSPFTWKSPHQYLPGSDPSIPYYKDEFDFLWDSGQTYQAWHDSQPHPAEHLTPGEYTVLYPSHEINASLEKENWTFCRLTIEEENQATLQVNTAGETASEYSYRGSVQVTRNNIFLSLSDKQEQESVNLSMSRPFHDKNRFLGILTALSPAGQPVAFKFACVKSSLLEKLDYPLLGKVLLGGNQAWDNGLMILEMKDLNIFYSGKIFTDHRPH